MPDPYGGGRKPSEWGRPPGRNPDDDKNRRGGRDPYQGRGQDNPPDWFPQRRPPKEWPKRDSPSAPPDGSEAVEEKVEEVTPERWARGTKTTGFPKKWQNLNRSSDAPFSTPALILKAREQELLLKSETQLFKAELRDEGVSNEWIHANDDLIKQYVQSTMGQRVKDTATGAMEGLSNWADRDYFGGPGIRGHAEKGRAAAEAEGKNQTWGQVKGGLKGLATRGAQFVTAPQRFMGKVGNWMGAGAENLAARGQRTNENITQDQQTALATGQRNMATTEGTDASGNPTGITPAMASLQAKTVAAAKPAPIQGQDPAQLEQQTLGPQQTTGLPSMTNALQGNPDQVNLNTAGVDPNQTVSNSTVTNNTGTNQTTNTSQNNTGQTNTRVGGPQDIAQAAKIEAAKKQSQTTGGIGTGILSNIATLGGAKLLREGYNAYQRKLGRDKIDAYSQGDFTRSLHFNNELNDVYDTIALRKGIQERNTTEALRNGFR